MASGGKVKVKGHATVLAGPSNGVGESGKAVYRLFFTKIKTKSRTDFSSSLNLQDLKSQGFMCRPRANINS